MICKIRRGTQAITCDHVLVVDVYIGSESITVAKIPWSLLNYWNTLCIIGTLHALIFRGCFSLQTALLGYHFSLGLRALDGESPGQMTNKGRAQKAEVFDITRKIQEGMIISGGDTSVVLSRKYFLHRSGWCLDTYINIANIKSQHFGLLDRERANTNYQMICTPTTK